eukprot:SAG11_NODE_1825_length_4203_cov_3.238304_6_plen_111_part_00
MHAHHMLTIRWVISDERLGSVDVFTLTTPVVRPNAQQSPQSVRCTDPRTPTVARNLPCVAAAEHRADCGYYASGAALRGRPGIGQAFISPIHRLLLTPGTLPLPQHLQQI